MEKLIISKISWILVFLIAISIFFISSLVFPVGPPGPPANYFAIAYHFFAFFWLAFFLLFALVQEDPNKNWFIFIAIIIAIFYGISDEIHQLFVPGRYGTFSDFLINTTGILSASFIYILLRREEK